jgi:uncharacterized Zn finger protein
MPRCDAEPSPSSPPSPPVMSNCPDCDAQLALLRIIPGRTAEYWTLRCTHCGGIHLSIVEGAATSPTS